MKKGKQYYFGMKLHIGVDADTGIVHSLSATWANVHDVTEAHRLLHAGEQQVWGDAGYTGVQQRKENLGLDVDWRLAMKPGKRRLLVRGGLEEWAERRKASVRAGQGGAPLPGREETVRLCQGTLPGIGQEHPTNGPAAGTGQLQTGPVLDSWLTQGVVRPLTLTTPKFGYGRVNKTSSQCKSTGAEAPHQAAPGQHIHKGQFFRRSLDSSAEFILSQAEGLRVTFR